MVDGDALRDELARVGTLGQDGERRENHVVAADPGVRSGRVGYLQFTAGFPPSF